MAREPRLPPEPWNDQRKNMLHNWELPIFAGKYVVEWIVYYLARWGLLRILEYSSFLSVMFAVLVYFSEAPDRKKQKHYQAWQVINTAQGKGGSGGRIEALQELNADKIPLIGVDVSGAFLREVRLPNAMLVRSDFQGADLRDCMLQGAHMDSSNLQSANFRGANLRGVRMMGSDLESADLFEADLTGADVSRTNLKDVDLRQATLKGLVWAGIVSVEAANVYGVKSAPDGFVEWALKHGAISKKGDE